VENVRDSDVKDSVSPIIQNIMNALGLDFEACYKTGYKLRYGHVMFMMDQDADGIHTKGLLLNIFGKYWPSLLKIDRFLSDFTTLLVKAEAKDGGAEEIFYTMESFNRSDVKRDIDSWNITHIKVSLYLFLHFVFRATYLLLSIVYYLISVRRLVCIWYLFF